MGISEDQKDKPVPTEFSFFLAGEITQVMDSIPWVRCASANVSSQCWKFISDLVESVECRQDLQLVLERGFLEQS